MSEDDGANGNNGNRRRQRSEDEDDEQEAEIHRARSVTAKRWRQLAHPLSAPDDDGENIANNNNNNDELNLDDIPDPPLGARNVLRNPVPKNFYARLQNVFGNASLGDPVPEDEPNGADGDDASDAAPPDPERVPGRPMMPRGQDDFAGADMDDDLGRTRNEDMPEAEPDEVRLLIFLGELIFLF
jgi:hypothetical protein